MIATRTLNLDFDVVRPAEREAKAYQTTLPKEVAHQLRVMPLNRQDSRHDRSRS